MVSLLLITIRFDDNFLENYFRGENPLSGATFWRLGFTNASIFVFGLRSLLWFHEWGKLKSLPNFRWMEAASGMKAAHVGKLGMIAAMISR